MAWLRPVLVDSCFRHQRPEAIAESRTRGDTPLTFEHPHELLAESLCRRISFSCLDSTMEPSSRPGMRRKPSASTLLSPFQGSRTGTALQNGGPLKEWEASSSISDVTVTSLGASSLSTLSVPSSSIESVRETLSRRLLAIAHIRQSYEGFVIELNSSMTLVLIKLRLRKQHWLNTVLIDGIDLEKTYNNISMRKRCAIGPSDTQ